MSTPALPAKKPMPDQLPAVGLVLVSEIGLVAVLSADDRLAYDYDRATAEARARLGGARFAAEWAAGQAVGAERAIAEALDDTPPLSG